MGVRSDAIALAPTFLAPRAAEACTLKTIIYASTAVPGCTIESGAAEASSTARRIPSLLCKPSWAPLAGTKARLLVQSGWYAYVRSGKGVARDGKSYCWSRLACFASGVQREPARFRNNQAASICAAYSGLDFLEYYRASGIPSSHDSTVLQSNP